MPKRSRPQPSTPSELSALSHQFNRHLKHTSHLLAKDQTYTKETALLTKMQRQGTLGDKVTALVLKVQSSKQQTEHFLDFPALQALLALAEKPNRREAESAIIALKELFSEHILPNYALKSLSQTSAPSLQAAYEAQVKSHYHRYLSTLSLQLSNSVSHFKQQIIRLLADLAALKPEGREKILSLMINKLGDPDKKVPTTVVLEVTRLGRRRRFMMEEIVREIGSFIFRSQQSAKSKFYSVVLLNALKIQENEQSAIKLMIQICLKLFPSLQNESEHTKTLSLLLQCTNKLFAMYAGKGELQFYSEEMDNLYRLTHFEGNQIVQLQALRFIFQAEKALGTVSDRYYRTLYAYILPSHHLRSINSKTLTLFFNTLLISVKEDVILTRVQAFVKRMLMCCLITDTHFVCGMLLVLGEIVEVHKGVWTMVTDKVESDEEEQYFDVPDSEDERPPVAPLVPLPSKPTYNPTKREPKYSNAHLTCLYELNLLATHYHPTVRKWAKSLLSREKFTYSGDPLLDFSMVNFLERYSYQAPKPKLMAKLTGKKVRMSLTQDSVNSANFAQLDDSAVREDELFFKHYFNIKRKNEEIEQKSDQEIEENEENEGFDFSDIDENEDNFELLAENEESDEDKPGKKKKLPTFADAEEYSHLLR